MGQLWQLGKLQWVNRSITLPQDLACECYSQSDAPLSDVCGHIFSLPSVSENATNYLKTVLFRDQNIDTSHSETLGLTPNSSIFSSDFFRE